MLSDYDNVVLSVCNGIQSVMAAPKNAEKPEVASAESQLLREMSAVTLEEFSFLLGKPGNSKKTQPKPEES